MKPEPFVQKVVLERYSLQLEKIPETNVSKTPDFSLNINGELVMVAELKTLGDVEPSEKTGWEVSQPEPDIFEYQRSDNSASRVEKAIRRAHKQLINHSCLRCLIVLNDDLLMDVADLDNVVFGYYEALDGRGNVFHISTDDGPYKRSRDVTSEIDLIIWIDVEYGSVKEDGVFIRVLSTKGREFALAHLR